MSSIINDEREWIQNAIKKYAEWESLYLWKAFEAHQYELLKSYVCLSLYGLLYGSPSQEEQNISDIWRKFPDKQQKNIDELSRKFNYENGRVVVAHTYLYLDDDKIACVFRQLKSNDDVIFIDDIGRVYKSWTHFLNTNRLPNCHYVAPDDGMHKIKQTLLEYKSPAAGIGHVVLKGADIAATGTSIVGGVLLILGTAPILAFIIAVASTVYAIGRNIGVLVDRGVHEESIGFNNAQSASAWLTVITGASSLVLSQSALIVENAGNFANVARIGLQGFNYAALASNLCNFGTYAYFLQLKIENGEELTAFDLMQGCVSIFLIFGAVSNTKQMHNYINSLETAPTTLTGRLTRSVKQSLKELQIQLHDNEGNAGVKEVTVWEENIPSWGLNFVLNARQQFLAKHTNIQHIYYKCLEILSTCCDFRYQKIDVIVFFSNMTNHIQNLLILVSNGLVSIKERLQPFLKQYFSWAIPDSLIEQIGHMIGNTTTAVKNVDETLIEDNEEQPFAENESKLCYEIIFETAKNRIPETTKSNDIISVFGYQLLSLVCEIMIEAHDNYEEWVSKNEEKMDKTDASKRFSKLGIKTPSDFANLNFVHIMKNKNTTSVNRNVENELTLQKVSTLYEKLLFKVAPRSTLVELGVLETCQFLKRSIIEFFPPLGERFKSAKDMYELGAPLGHHIAMNSVFYVLNVRSNNRSYVMNDSTFFELAADGLPLDKISRELSAELSDCKQISKTSNQLSDENIRCSVLFLCDKFYRKVDSMLRVTGQAEREERVKDCYHYLMGKFTASIQNMEKERKNELSDCFEFQNDVYFDRRKFASVFRKACEAQKHEMFASAVEYFTQEENLQRLAQQYITERRNFDNFFVEVFTEIDKEDGVQMFSIDEGSFSSLRAYMQRAASLFDLDENRMELVKWENGVVILECGDKIVVFQNVYTKSMIVMEFDTSNQLNSNYFQ
ncbi:uncharacterized protein LOC135839679 [Planococcus citri]|uniref:uncharacterized protein LOC135839679 n=1 Tax=Planococcus citri TaxID=170843 RepID=UPI0031F854B6